MKRIISLSIFALAFLLCLSTASATDVGRSRNFGLGFQVGNPTAITGKVFFSSENSLDFGVGFGGWGWGDRDRRCWDSRRQQWYRCGDYYDRYHRDLSLHLDYLWENTLAEGSARLNFYIGVGGRLLFWDRDDPYYDDRMGLIARMPLGLALAFRRPDFLELFFEVDPGLFIIPFFDFHVDAALGVRFYF